MLDLVRPAYGGRRSPIVHLLYPSQLEAQLKALRLPGMAKALSGRLKQAEAKNLSHAELVALLCEDEVTARADNKRQKLFKSAKLPFVKGLEDFEFAFQPSLNKR
jgi:DNA replication protein DnaC